MAARYRPVIGGVSSGNLQTGATGTVGAPVYDPVTGNILLLSNAHVFEESGNIIQPGSVDGGDKTDIIGRVIRSSELVPGAETFIDAAIATPISTDLISPEIKDIGVIKGIVSPEVGMIVYKSGRTTQLTKAVITDINAALIINYTQGRISFNDLIYFKGEEPTVMGGDSGSVLVTYIDGEPYAVGLVFAGPASAPFTYGVACKIQNVMADFGIALSISDSDTTLNDEMPVQVSGIIVDIETLIGIPDVRIIIDGYETFTDQTGRYSIGIAEPGVYTIQMYAQNYYGGEGTIELDLGENTASFTLTKRGKTDLSTFLPILIGVTAGAITIATSVIGGK